jgi:RNA polymerase sigma factor (sigma-70 family)
MDTYTSKATKLLFDQGVKYVSADELVSDLYMKVMGEKNIPFTRGESPDNYLFITMRNLLIDKMRKQKRNDDGLETDENTEDGFPVNKTTEMDHGDISNLLGEALGMLTDKQHFFFTECEVKKRDVNEVAEEEGVSSNTVYQHLFQAKNKMKKGLLNKYPLDELLELLPWLHTKDKSFRKFRNSRDFDIPSGDDFEW